MDWGLELQQVYEILNMPDKIGMIDQILDMYKGKESHMMKHILIKYKVKICNIVFFLILDSHSTQFLKDVLPTEFTYHLTEIIQHK